MRLSEDYEARKRALADAMLAAAETALPGLSAHIVHRLEASPIAYARYDHASDGAIYGVSRGGRLRGAESPIRGLVVAGAATTARASRRPPSPAPARRKRWFPVCWRGRACQPGAPPLGAACAA